MVAKAKLAAPVTLRTRLTRLDYAQACKLLGPDGKRLLAEGAKFEDVDIAEDVYLRGDLFRLTLRGVGDAGDDVRVTFTLMAGRNKRLAWNCDHCETACSHVGAAFSLVLEEKYSLGLSELPKEGVPLEHLSEQQLVERALAERAKRARDERFRLKSSDSEHPWTDYLVTSMLSGKTYRVALRGSARGESYCSCPDFRVNTLGTCKHILYALGRVRQKFTAGELAKPHRRRGFAIHLQYGTELTLHLAPPDRIPPDATRIVQPFADGPISDLPGLLKAVRKLESNGHNVVVYPDAEQWIQHNLFLQQTASYCQEIRRAPAQHALRRELLKTELLPYQLDGIAFAVGAGRAILADDMGLGKTIQGIGVAELLARLADIRRVLIVCPASLKAQWQSEIHRFSERDCQLVIGSAEERADLYDSDCFFTVCNYEQILRDLEIVDRVRWDLIILDEGQRIKNWTSKTSRFIKCLKSPFALVLSGTPLENRLDDLYSVVQFIDDRRLEPAFRFFHRHRVVDERGKVLGYKNLDQLRENLKPILLRRTRQSVLQELPERTTEILRIAPTKQQQLLSDQNVKIAAQIAAKKYLTEMDLLRLQKALLNARLACNSTCLVNKKKPGHSSKLEFMDELLEQLFREADRKAVLFSEWTRMLDLIEPLLGKHEIDFVRLDGSVPQKKRQQLVHRFQHDPECRLFLTTNAGSTGLNLQAANTVINVDLPWNPAVLEQRIARAHRMGQHRPVDVYLLVTADTFEERMLNTLADKQNLALAALDMDSQVSAVELHSGIEELRQRLEVLLGPKPIAPLDAKSQQQAAREVVAFGSHRDRVAAAGGQLLGAVFEFLGELVDEGQAPAPPDDMVATVRQRLGQCVEQDPRGRQQLTITLPNQGTLDRLAHTLASLLATSEPEAGQ